MERVSVDGGDRQEGYEVGHSAEWCGNSKMKPGKQIGASLAEGRDMGNVTHQEEQ